MLLFFLVSINNHTKACTSFSSRVYLLICLAEQISLEILTQENHLLCRHLSLAIVGHGFIIFLFQFIQCCDTGCPLHLVVLCIASIHLDEVKVIPNHLHLHNINKPSLRGAFSGNRCHCNLAALTQSLLVLLSYQ